MKISGLLGFTEARTGTGHCQVWDSACKRFISGRFNLHSLFLYIKCQKFLCLQEIFRRESQNCTLKVNGYWLLEQTNTNNKNNSRFCLLLFIQRGHLSIKILVCQGFEFLCLTHYQNDLRKATQLLQVFGSLFPPL